MTERKIGVVRFAGRFHVFAEADFKHLRGSRLQKTLRLRREKWGKHAKAKPRGRLPMFEPTGSLGLGMPVVRIIPVEKGCHFPDDLLPNR